MNISKNDILFGLAILTAVWFALMGMVWVYGAALVIAYPVGLISFFLWRSIRKENRSRTSWIPGILLTGLVLSLSVLVYLLIFE